MDAIPSLEPLRRYQTTKNGEICKGFKKEEDYEQPLSPIARLFHEPGSNVYVIGIMGLKTKIRPDIIRENLLHTFLKNRRFTSLQVLDKKDGSMKWIPTHINIDDHIIIAKLDPNMESPQKFVENYISNLSRSPVENTKPLWDFHILDVKTSKQVEGTFVIRFHHSLGDGISLMNLVLNCSRKTSDHEALPTLQGNNKSSALEVASLWRLHVLWNSFVAVLMFVFTAMFLKDTETPMRGSEGLEHRPRRVVVRSVSIDDIKMVKKAMNATFNDVVLGITQAGLYRYLHGRYSEIDNKKVDIPNKMRFRATFLFNLRATTRIDDFTDTNTHGTWGNKIGFVLLPLNIIFKKDPLDYIRDAKATMKRKKASFEPLFTYLTIKIVTKLLGIKRRLNKCSTLRIMLTFYSNNDKARKQAAGKLTHKVFYNTTLGFSNIPGLTEEISFLGHKVESLAVTCYGQPVPLMIHVLSYKDRVTFTISVDEETIPDPLKLCDDLEESLRGMKACAHKLHPYE